MLEKMLATIKKVVKRNNKSISMVLAMAIVFGIMGTSIPAFAETETGSTEVKGTVIATIITYEFPLITTFEVDPNQEAGSQFTVAGDLNFGNLSNAPLNLYLEDFGQVLAGEHYKGFTDVLPDKYTPEEWAKLGKTDSMTNFALAVKFIDGSVEGVDKWRELTQTEPLYVASVEDAKLAGVDGKVLIGSINPKENVQFTLEASHGTSFNTIDGQPIEVLYNVVWVFELA